VLGIGSLLLLILSFVRAILWNVLGIGSLLLILPFV
jgi:hypothetical protein